MASAPTHLIATGAVAAWFQRPGVPRRLWVWGAALAVAPDLDVIGYRLGVPYESMLGHRGLTHSLPFAAAASGAAILTAFRAGAGSLSRGRAWLFLFLAMALHGVLDALTDGGLGVAFFAPLSGARYFFPWRPIAVSPLSVTRFLSGRGVAILANEFAWVWVPSLAMMGLAWWWRRRTPPPDGPGGRA